MIAIRRGFFDVVINAQLQPQSQTQKSRNQQYCERHFTIKVTLMYLRKSNHFRNYELISWQGTIGHIDGALCIGDGPVTEILISRKAGAIYLFIRFAYMNRHVGVN